MDILGLGDNVCDIYVNQRMMYPGGQALNVAANASEYGVSAGYLGTFGCDEIAEHIKRTLTNLQIDIRKCRTFPGRNGYAKVAVKDGDRVFLGSNKGGVLRTHPIILSPEDVEYCSTFCVIHTSNNSYMDNELIKLKSLPSIISYDFSMTWQQKERLRNICPLVDIAFLSGSGMAEVEADAVADMGQKYGCKIICVTRGSDSTLIYDGKNKLSVLPKNIIPVDTMGAGDSFAAILLANISKAVKSGVPFWNDADCRRNVLHSAASAAAEWAASVCMRYGALGQGISISDELWNEITMK